MLDGHSVCDCFPLFTFESKAVIYAAEYCKVFKYFALSAINQLACEA